MRNFLKSLKDRHRNKSQKRRRSALACEPLENRVVLTVAGSTSLLGSLSYVGVVTSPQVSTSIPILPILPILPGPILPLATSAPVRAWSKLGTDLQTLRTELQSLAGKSGVTIADLESLTTDSQSIAQAGFQFQVKSLNSTISELATAVAGGTPTSQAQTDFTALFSGSSVPATTIDTTFTDLVQTLHDSAVTTADLSTVAADEAAIQADLSKLPIAWFPGIEPWLDQVGNTPDAVTLAPIVVSPVAAALPPITVPPAIIISPFGGATLLGALSSVGVVTSPVLVSPPITILPPVSAIASGPFSQLQTDVRALNTELQSLAGKSGLTIADLQNLVSDGQAINQAGFFFNVQSLEKVVSELATAVAGGSPTTQAQTDFTALFSKSSVSTTTINTAFSDLVKAVQDSKVLPTELTTVAADQAAIQADLKNLFSGKGGGSGSGTGTTGSGTGTTGSGTGTTGSGTGTTGSGTGTTGSGTGTTGSGTTGSGTGTTGSGTGTTGTATGGTTGSGSKGRSSGHKRSRGHKVHHESHLVVKSASHSHAKTLSRSKKR